MFDSLPPGNRLLAALPGRDWEGMRPDFREVELPSGQVLVGAGEPFRELYFPLTCVVATVATFGDAATIEMATVGREGMAGVGAALGSDTALSRHVVQMPGSALVIGNDAFERLAREVPAFRRVLLAYAQAFLVQVMQSVACNGVHPVEARAARWLLACHDRVGRDTFPLTQEFLAAMLGVSRVAVSLAGRSLQRAGLIRHGYGVMTVEDRAGLEGVACECYGIVRQQYERRLARVRERNDHADEEGAGLEP